MPLPPQPRAYALTETFLKGQKSSRLAGPAGTSTRLKMGGRAFGCGSATAGCWGARSSSSRGGGDGALDLWKLQGSSGRLLAVWSGGLGLSGRMISTLGELEGSRAAAGGRGEQAAHAGARGRDAEAP